ncbi:MAG: HAD hydrolase-like protein [Prevotellaceae bacterium]|jgi:FMN phosphatase YigB (HAD superfamily)|nr:HAD hydrolase-like protein [Prevotellaceae bacterium]
MTNKFSTEQLQVASLFKECFQYASDKPIILYGVGKNTGAILTLCSEIPIAGLMDSKMSGYMYGLPILSNREAAELHADVVIIARNSVVPIIYQRISKLEDQGCRIFYVNGQRVSDAINDYNNEEFEYWDRCYADLVQAIDRTKHISFDIFDTLLGRRTLTPVSSYNYDIEFDVSFLRRDVAEAFQYAVSVGKDVCLISDTFYSTTELRQLLSHSGLTTDKPIYASCEAGFVKEDGGLYRLYLEQTGYAANDCLHVGDNRYADVLEADKLGMHTFLVMNGYNLLENSAARMVLSDTCNTKADSALGVFVSEVFSSPFALNNTIGYLMVDNLYTLGYTYLAPLVCAFLQWFIRKISTLDIDMVLFPSRDGYVFQKCYDIVRTAFDEKLPESAYLKTSRRCVTVASVFDSNDIRRIANRVYYGKVRNFFRDRFGIQVDCEDADSDWITESELADRLLRKYENRILINSSMERSEYMGYLCKITAASDDIAFFDFVSSGTVHYNLQRLTGKTMKGFYFATNNIPNEMFQEGEIETAFGNILSYGNYSLFSKFYLVLESIFNDSDSTLIKFSDGQPIFSEMPHNYDKIREAHEGIIDYIYKYYCLPHSLEISEKIANLLFNGSCVVSHEVKACFLNDDIYDGVLQYNSWK